MIALTIVVASPLGINMTPILNELIPALGRFLKKFVDALRSTCTLEKEPNSVKQEDEKHDEVKRSALRAVAALLQIPSAGELDGKPLTN